MSFETRDSLVTLILALEMAGVIAGLLFLIKPLKQGDSFTDRFFKWVVILGATGAMSWAEMQVVHMQVHLWAEEHHLVP